MNILNRLIIEPFDSCYEKVLHFLPNILTSIILIIIGIILGVIFKKLFTRFFRAINIDKMAERAGMFEMLEKSGIKDPLSTLISKVIGWVIVVTFIIVSMQNLRIPTVEQLLERFFLYLPNIFIAAFILLIGYLLSNFFGRAVLIASVNAGIKTSGLIGKFVKLTVFILACTMVMEQLGIGKETILIAFAVVFGGIVLAFAIAFGLGGKDIARDYLEKKITGENHEGDDGITHL